MKANMILCNLNATKVSLVPEPYLLPCSPHHVIFPTLYLEPTTESVATSHLLPLDITPEEETIGNEENRGRDDERITEE